MPEGVKRKQTRIIEFMWFQLVSFSFVRLRLESIASVVSSWCPKLSCSLDDFWYILRIESYIVSLDILREANWSPTPTSKTNDFL